MLILFEVGLFIARRLHRHRKADDETEHKTLTDAEMTAMLDSHEKENPVGTKRKK